MTKSLTITAIVATANWIAQTAQRCDQSQVTAAKLDEIARLLRQAETLLGKVLSNEVRRA
jgi:hypothetical protein